ncbi:MAG TPA: SDR family oxidoreductase [Anaerolineales bacterium]|nr:SDR family oxidoreductase [Anaerolineales bacterium]
MKLKPIHEQVVVVVGANSGIGRETALQFAEGGAKVVVAGRSLPSLNELVEKIESKGGEAAAHEADVSDFTQMQALAERAVELYGRIDTWVHAAAVSVYAPFQETKPEEFRQLIEVNLIGQAFGAMAALPHLKRSGGALIHIGSLESKRALPLHSAYSASKHGMIGFIDALRVELMHDRTPVSVTTILPAGINTPFFDKSLTRLGVKPRPSPPIYEPEVVARAILHAAEHPVRELYVGGAGKSLEWLHLLSPSLADRAFSRIGYRPQLTSTPKTDQARHNLYEHLEGYDRAQGTFSAEAKSISMYTGMKRHLGLRWGLLGLLAGAGYVLLTRRKPAGWRMS